jgi:hypothetical protein
LTIWTHLTGCQIHSSIVYVVAPEGKVIAKQCYYSYLHGTRNKLATSYLILTFSGFKTRYSKCYEDISDRLNTARYTAEKLYTYVQGGEKMEHGLTLSSAGIFYI